MKDILIIISLAAAMHMSLGCASSARRYPTTIPTEGQYVLDDGECWKRGEVANFQQTTCKETR